jgi:hypothetical protein
MRYLPACPIELKELKKPDNYFSHVTGNLVTSRYLQTDSFSLSTLLIY